MSRSANWSRIIKSFGRQDLIFFLVYIVTFKLLSMAYYYTLQGGDLTFIFSSMPIFGAIIFPSSWLSFTMTVVPIFHIHQVNPLTKIASLGLGWYIYLQVILSDMGTTLLRHGQYNFTGFCAAWVPAFILFIMIKMWLLINKIIPTRVAIGFLVGLVTVSFVYWEYASARALESWNKGLFDELSYEMEMCNIRLEGVPWASILPNKFFNFFTGSDECPEIEVFSSVGTDGMLSVNCSQPTALVIENPDFLFNHTDPFVLDETGITDYQKMQSAKTVQYEVEGNSQVQTHSEYLQVFCGEHQNYHVNSFKNQTIVERVEQYHKSTRSLNLLMLQIDALSRAHFMRKMERTVDYLRYLNQTGIYNVNEFYRDVTLGFNTERNTRALYTGSQLRQDRAGKPIWELFQENGNVAYYINGFCEDWAQRFLKRPMFGVDKFTYLPWCHPDYHPVNSTFSNFNGVNSIRRRCIVGEHTNARMFNYLKQFWGQFKDNGKFVLMAFQEAHEGSSEVILTLDPNLTDMLNHMHQTGELENTVMILASDHGSHMSMYFTFSSVGAIEHKMPLLIFITPKWLTDKYPHLKTRMDKNKQNLMSHYDTYWTIRSLAALPEFGGEFIDYNKLNEYTSVWDCNANQKYIKDIWYFKGKKFYDPEGRSKFPLLVDLVFKKMQLCIKQFDDITPQQKPIRDTATVLVDSYNALYEEIPITLDDVSPCKKCLGVTVMDAIQDLNSYYWLMDAVIDMELHSLNYDVNEYANRLENVQREHQLDYDTQTMFYSQKLGRYRFGRSMLDFEDYRTCTEIGSHDCPCNKDI